MEIYPNQELETSFAVTIISISYMTIGIILFRSAALRLRMYQLLLSLMQLCADP